MRTTFLSSLSILALAAAPALAQDAPDPAAVRDEALDWFEPIPMNPPVLEGNAATRARVDLGAQLFFDPRLSR